MRSASSPGTISGSYHSSTKDDEPVSDEKNQLLSSPYWSWAQTPPTV
ncbi:hypothetical protein [Georgenia satyanarayanai]|nr:hypothetical protein [Georgenia satyanarayanai]